MFENILSNRFTQLALVFAAFGGLISDQLGSGYWIVIVISIAIGIYSLYDEISKKKIYNAPNIPIPIVFNISNPADSRSALNSLFDKLEKNYPNHKKNLEKYLNIIESDLVFKYNGDIYGQERFIDFLKISKHDISRLNAQTPTNTIYHIAYIGPIANSILIGTIFGTDSVVLYQYSKASDSYSIQLKIDSRKFKSNIEKNEIFEKNYIGNFDNIDTVTVAIDIASHRVSIEKADKPIIHLKSKIGSTITDDKNFIKANREIYTLLNGLQQKNYKNIKLIYSMPTTIGIMLGMSIQTYWNIELTQFDRGEYKTVIDKMNKIKYYF